MPTLAERYTAAFPKSRACFERARELFPTGVTHDTRMLEPFPVYVERRLGCGTSGMSMGTNSSTTSSATARTFWGTPTPRLLRQCVSRWAAGRTPARATNSKFSGASWS